MAAKKKSAGSVSKSGSGSVAKSNGNGNHTEATPAVLNKALSGMSVEEIEAQLEARKTSEITDLESRLEKLRAESGTVEQRIAMLRGAARTPRRGGGGKGSRGARAVNERPLTQYLHEILKGANEPMTARQLEEKLSETDYKSNAKNKYVVIFTALSKNKDMFKKTDRGHYAAI